MARDCSHTGGVRISEELLGERFHLRSKYIDRQSV